ncbi:phage tail sheath subtilisin-like domain-containing protein [Spirulina sp. CS-785/01]|uniref:phage tail sheath family protein n=1 Tax=Spirulina sp. CS-785/01 TaxID=3021716 RepID=UPI00232D64E1|nr:phage tail sheath subtilisin-like domain-containing protein [Spirulina sp. CS-785/01]MDB9315293.1 phage tail sheath subtilisin-like domain-containing protein [Spirulina sp. CS-785/01]
MQPFNDFSLTAPGVSRSAIASLPREGLTTGIPVFLGLAAEGSTQKDLIGQPQALTLWPQFLRQFGAASLFLTQAVQGFFENGGQLCYILLLWGEGEPTPSLTVERLRQGLQTLESLDSIDLVCVPDIMQTASRLVMRQLQTLVLEHCDRMGDRFAILDSYNTSNLEELSQQRQQLIGDNGAIYAPWIMVEKVSQPIPPCGHIAGVYARNDREKGVHHAPANYILNGVLDLSLTLRDRDWETLNVKAGPGINSIRSFRSRGIRVWGSRTVSSIPGWQYVSVRRLIATILRWAEQNLAGVAFEPNNSALWIRLSREIAVYCESLWEQGALQGEDPEAAFYVKCDAETNPPAVRDLGQVIAEVGIAPTTPAEFIVISLVHGSSGVTFA